MTEDEWVAVWTFGIIKKRKTLEKFIYQALRDLVKLGGENVIQNFEEKFKELRVEGCRKDGSSSSSVMYTEDEERMEEYSSDKAETKGMMFMGTESKAR